MPRLPQPVVTKAWRHTGETGRIHFIATKPDGTPRHLYTDEGEALYEVLDNHLAVLGYTGPASSGEH